MVTCDVASHDCWSVSLKAGPDPATSPAGTAIRETAVPFAKVGESIW